MNASRASRKAEPAPPLTVEPDALCMQKIASGDLAALGRLYERHGAVVRGFLRRATGAADADDLTHEVFLAVVPAAIRYDGRENAKPFLLGIAAMHLRERRRVQHRIARALEGLGRMVTRAVTRTPEDDAAGLERHEVFERALQRLSEDKRLVFLMVESEGLTGGDVAAALGLPIGTVWTRLHHARRELRAALEETR